MQLTELIMYFYLKQVKDTQKPDWEQNIWQGCRREMGGCSWCIMTKIIYIWSE